MILDPGQAKRCRKLSRFCLVVQGWSRIWVIMNFWPAINRWSFKRERKVDASVGYAKRGIDYNLRFISEVLGFDYLHWGYFPENRPSAGTSYSLAEVKCAQQAYTDHLLSFIPSGVGTILDVGCGLGKTADQLKARGYRVHCLTSDAYQAGIIRERYPDLPLTMSRFEDFATAERFDLIMMSESAQYLDWPQALAAAGRILNQGGYLLVSDYFRKTDDQYYRTCKILDVFRAQTSAASYALLREEDITERVLATLDFGSSCYNRYVLPTMAIISEMAEERLSPLQLNLIRFLFKRQIAGVNRYLREKTPEKLDAALFRDRMRYLIQLWRQEGEARP